MGSFIYQMLTTVLAVLLSSLFSILTVTLNRKSRRKNSLEESRIKEVITSQDVQDVENSIIEISNRMPEGMNEEQYFQRLRKELSEISYLQIKNPVPNKNTDVVYDLLKTHHQQALQQSSVQFWFSLFSSIIGFVFIIVML